VATVPENGGVFVSLRDIYGEQLSTTAAVKRLESKVAEVEKDVSETRADVSAIKGRQWPPLATSILGGSVVAVVATVLGFVVK
jgi:hypothetical protein